jgi:hypothetical protein
MHQAERQAGFELELLLGCRRQVEALFERYRLIRVSIPGAINCLKTTLTLQAVDVVPIVEQRVDRQWHALDLRIRPQGPLARLYPLKRLEKCIIERNLNQG